MFPTRRVWHAVKLCKSIGCCQWCTRAVCCRCRAFSLVELLVALAVFGVLLTGVVQILNGAVSITGRSYTKIRADAEARGVFDRIFFDHKAMIKDTTASLVVSSNIVTFGSSLRGADQKKRGEVVRYVMTQEGIQRRIRAIEWSEIAIGPFSQDGEEAQLLGRNVVKMVVRVVLSDGTVADGVSAPSMTGLQEPYPTYLVIGLALADRKTVDALKLDAALLVPAIAQTELPVEKWAAAEGGGEKLSADAAKIQLRFYQHIFKL